MDINNFLESKRIFVVEDDVLNLAIINQLLSKSRAIVYQNYNSIGIAVHVAQNLPIDLVLMDLMLRGGVSGFDVIRKLRENPATKDIPVVAVSSMDPEDAILRAKAAGFNGFISKPINAATFASDLIAVINGRERWVISR